MILNARALKKYISVEPVTLVRHRVINPFMIESETNSQDIKEKRLSRQYRCFIGLDLSIHNPGVVCRIQSAKNNEVAESSISYHCIYFAKTRIQERSQLYDDHKNSRDELYLHHLKKKPKRELFKCEMDWYIAITDLLMKKLFSVLKSYSLKSREIFAMIENYAFRQTKTSSLTKLAEGACLAKYHLRIRGIRYKLYANNTVKKCWSGYGHATKERMWLAFRTRFPHFADDMEEHFSWSYDDKKEAFRERAGGSKSKSGGSKDNALATKKRKSMLDNPEWSWLNDAKDDDEPNLQKTSKKRKRVGMVVQAKSPPKTDLTIPHPIEDLVDAFGLIATHLWFRYNFDISESVGSG
jgi:hypothetical protein